MKVTKKELEKSQIELVVELTLDEFKPYIERGVEKVSKEVKIKGFRSGKVPFDVLKQKVGEMSILEESARLAINKTIDIAIKDNVKSQPVGQPQVDIIKLAPENNLEYKVTFSVVPEITLGDYKNAKVKAEKIEIKDDESKKLIEQLQTSRVKETIVDREIKMNDKAIVNIQMFLDNVPIEGGQSQDTAIILGKDYLVPGFDKKLVGAKKQDKKEFKLPYPKDHHQQNIAGKMVEFKVEIKEVYNRELPEINDEFAKTLGTKGLDDLKKNIKKNITAEKEQAAEQKQVSQIFDKILEKTKIGDIPKVLIDHESDKMIDELKRTVEGQGGKFEDYLSSLKKTADQLALDILPDAIKRIKVALIIREIAVQEKIEITEKEIDTEIKKLLAQYKGYDKVEQHVKEPGYRMFVHNSLSNQKIIDKLKKWNLEK